MFNFIKRLFGIWDGSPRDTIHGVDAGNCMLRMLELKSQHTRTIIKMYTATPEEQIKLDEEREVIYKKMEDLHTEYFGKEKDD